MNVFIWDFVVEFFIYCLWNICATSAAKKNISLICRAKHKNVFWMFFVYILCCLWCNHYDPLRSDCRRFMMTINEGNQYFLCCFVWEEKIDSNLTSLLMDSTCGSRSRFLVVSSDVFDMADDEYRCDGLMELSSSVDICRLVAAVVMSRGGTILMLPCRVGRRKISKTSELPCVRIRFNMSSSGIVTMLYLSMKIT